LSIWNTSALVKRYVQEPGSAIVRAAFRRRRIATVRIAHAELAATIARLWRDDAISETVRERLIERIAGDFSMMDVVEVRRPLVESVIGLVRRSPLRGYDAVRGVMIGA
jgi:predicted nucleic acid-binding protein